MSLSVKPVSSKQNRTKKNKKEQVEKKKIMWDTFALEENAIEDTVECVLRLSGEREK